MTTEEAIAFHDSEGWRQMTKTELAIFQLWEEKLCVPFSVFHEAIEFVIGRPVWTHEFADTDALKLELLGKIGSRD